MSEITGTVKGLLNKKMWGWYTDLILCVNIFLTVTSPLTPLVRFVKT